MSSAWCYIIQGRHVIICVAWTEATHFMHPGSTGNSIIHHNGAYNYQWWDVPEELLPWKVFIYIWHDLFQVSTPLMFCNSFHFTGLTQIDNPMYASFPPFLENLNYKTASNLVCIIPLIVECTAPALIYFFLNLWWHTVMVRTKSWLSWSCQHSSVKYSALR